MNVGGECRECGVCGRVIGWMLGRRYISATPFASMRPRGTECRTTSEYRLMRPSVILLAYCSVPLPSPSNRFISVGINTDCLTVNSRHHHRCIHHLSYFLSTALIESSLQQVHTTTCTEFQLQQQDKAPGSYQDLSFRHTHIAHDARLRLEDTLLYPSHLTRRT